MAPLSSSARSSPPSPGSLDEQIDAILASTDQPDEWKIRRLLRLGVDALDLRAGYLSRVDPALHTLTVVVTCGPDSVAEEGAQYELGATLCRRAVVSSSPIALHDVSEQGSGEDPAVDRAGIESYLSTRLIPEDRVYGALCFTAPFPNDAPFTEDDLLLVETLGRAVEQVLATDPVRDVSEIGRGEIATQDLLLPRDRHLLERVFETSPSAIAILNAAGDFVQVSARAQEILGLERDAVTGRAFNDPEWHITAPDGQPIPEEKLPFARVRDTGEPVMGMEHVVEWPDGTRRLLSVSGAPLYREETFIGAVFHLDDITTRRETELSLRESEERFRGVFRNAALGIALLDDQGDIVHVNPVLTEMLGYDDSTDLRGRPYHAMSRSADGTTREPAVRELLDGDRAKYERETRFERRDGSTFWGHVTASAIDGPGEARVVAMVENIDQRKKQRERLRLFRKAVEQAEEAAIILEADPRDAPGPPIAYANPAFGALTGHDPEEAVGMPLGALFGPDSEDAVLEELWHALREGAHHECETIAYRADGTPFLTHWTIAPVRDDTGTITHWASVHRDVTETRMRGWQLVKAHDAERRRIDQEMHNQLGGLLTALQMTVDLARIEVRDEGGPTAPLDKIEARVDDLASAVRTITRRLHPKVLSDHGLTRALPSLVATLEERHDRPIRLDASLDGNERLPSLLEATIYRIVQETLLYALRSTEAGPLVLNVNRRPDSLALHVDAETASLPAAPTSGNDTSPLQALRRWIDQLDGTFKMNTEDDTLPLFEVTLPLAVSCLPEPDAGGHTRP
jgi:PAS domain S-box-containing protein